MTNNNKEKSSLKENEYHINERVRRIDKGDNIVSFEKIESNQNLEDKSSIIINHLGDDTDAKIKKIAEGRSLVQNQRKDIHRLDNKLKDLNTEIAQRDDNIKNLEFLLDKMLPVLQQLENWKKDIKNKEKIKLNNQNLEIPSKINSKESDMTESSIDDN